MPQRRIYLAGPDVFLPDAAGRAAALKAICARHRLHGVSPLDALAAEPPEWAALPEPVRIARRNEVHIESCAAVVANLTPFRGPSADAGTVFEIGYMRALGRPVFGWSNTATPFAARTRAFAGTAADATHDADGLLIEDFGMDDNLMISAAIASSGGTCIAAEVPAALRWTDLAAFDRCLATVALLLRGGLQKE